MLDTRLSAMAAAAVLAAAATTAVDGSYTPGAPRRLLAGGGAFNVELSTPSMVAMNIDGRR